jgi:hypothetical protein
MLTSVSILLFGLLILLSVFNSMRPGQYSFPLGGVFLMATLVVCRWFDYARTVEWSLCHKAEFQCFDLPAGAVCKGLKPGIVDAAEVALRL